MPTGGGSFVFVRSDRVRRKNDVSMSDGRRRRETVDDNADARAGPPVFVRRRERADSCRRWYGRAYDCRAPTSNGRFSLVRVGTDRPRSPSRATGSSRISSSHNYVTYTSCRRSRDVFRGPPPPPHPSAAIFLRLVPKTSCLTLFAAKTNVCINDINYTVFIILRNEKTKKNKKQITRVRTFFSMTLRIRWTRSNTCTCTPSRN